ncbi:Dehydrogenase/reductase SDR family member 7B [Acipenser ruthenus]|uniref:Dehydrogenase/reductase SDR family member 7B n=1 Tax=Acipenser ruthenus TaxID=7906 RepID=A0A444UCA6_ACIRT|nr:Dehydrogenase/reductase SDR family member 7B [Acipenser ruthenus]
MEFTSSPFFPLVLGSIGVVALYQLLLRVRQKTHIQDAVVVVTGASSGLGRECAKVFHAAGARLVLCGRDKERLQDLVKELTGAADSQRKTYPPSMVTFDLSDTEAVASAAVEVLQCFGHVDILINNAGISYRGTILETDVQVHKQVMDMNYFGAVALTKDAASKHATQAFFDCLRAEVEQFGIEVSVFSPGYIRTNLSVNAVTGNGSKYSVLDKNTAEGRDPHDIAMVMLNCVSRKKKDVLLAGVFPTLAVYFRTLCPSLFFFFMASRARKEQKLKDS